MLIGLVDYQAGNLRNVQKAVEHLGQNICVVSSGAKLKHVDAIILPGVGAFKQGMEKLTSAGFVESIRHEVLEKRKPLLGICLGMHLIGTTGCEGGGVTPGLNLLPFSVENFDRSVCGMRLPHVGWNGIKTSQDSTLFEGVPQNSDFYFAHSYHVQSKDKSLAVAHCDHGYSFMAAIEKDNIFATQFHPEKSQRYGLQVLENFLSYCDVVTKNA
jgi:glutamine amidotransferase